MPRNVRNFWLELDVDGCKTQVETGPRAADGGFSLTIRQRDQGGIMTALQVSGRATTDGRIVLEVEAPTGEIDQQRTNGASVAVETRR